MKAVDKDSGKFGRVTYSLKGQSGLDERFAIDPLTGKITVFKPLKESDMGKDIVLTITAADGGNVFCVVYL